jgi:hypothetical protein
MKKEKEVTLSRAILTFFLRQEADYHYHHHEMRAETELAAGIAAAII